MRLSVRLALVFGIGSLLAVSTIVEVAGYLTREEVIGSVDDSLRDRVAEVGELATLGKLANRTVAPPTAAADASATPFAGRLQASIESYLEESGLGLGLYRSDGTLIGGTRDLASDDLLAAAAAGRRPVETVTVDGRSFRVLAADATDLAGPASEITVVVLYEEVTSQMAAFDRLRIRLIGLALGAIATLTVAGWLAGRRLARPLDQVTTAAEDLARLDHLPGRIEITRSDEVGRLAAAFNRTLSALEVGREQQRRLVADASHGLRTPLASVRMRIEFLAGAGPLGPGQREDMLAGAVADLERLTALVDELVDLAADVRSGEEQPVVCPLRDILVDVADRSAAASGRRIELDADDTEAEVRPAMIRRAAQNLVDNAVKYSPDGTPIRLRSRAGAIEVIDEGGGIAPEDRALVFDRFYRSPRARSRPGNGIGLAIVKQVADLHGGEVWVGDDPGPGGRVGFSVTVGGTSRVGFPATVGDTSRVGFPVTADEPSRVAAPSGR